MPGRQHIPPCRRSLTAARLILAIVIVLATLLVASGQAQAAEGYTPTTLATACGSEWNGGQTDQRGYLYVSCGTSVQIFAPGATQAAPVQTLSVGGAQIYDVAPNADGSIVYVTTNWNGAHTLRRFVRAADGSYGFDTQWLPQQWSYGGASYTFTGQFIATDAWGDIWASQGIWTVNPARIIEFSPSGQVLTQFGEYMECGDLTSACSWAAGQFYTDPTGIGVSADGRRVYVTDNTNGRVQEWDWVNGQYVWTRMWGNTQATDPSRQGSCANGGFGSPYDVTVDRWGYVYVANTSCKQVQKFTADGTWLATVSVAGPNLEPNHGLAVDWDGDIWSGGTNIFAARTTEVPADPSAPAPLVVDAAAPTVIAVSVPATSSSLTLPVTLAATDNVGVTAIRIALDGGAWSAWQPYTTSLSVALPAGNGTKTVSVEAEDAVGNISAAASASTLYTAPAAPPPPTPKPDPEPGKVTESTTKTAAADGEALAPRTAPVVGTAAAAGPRGPVKTAVAARGASSAAPTLRTARVVSVRGRLLTLAFTSGAAKPTAARFALPRGAWTTWSSYGPTLRIELPASVLRAARHASRRHPAVTLLVQVRGAGRRLSTVRSVRVSIPV